MAKKRDIHVVPHKGDWATKREGGNRASSVHKTQREAIARARDVAHGKHIDVVVHGRDGRIRDSDTFGKKSRSGRIVKKAPRSGKLASIAIRNAVASAKRKRKS